MTNGTASRPTRLVAALAVVAVCFAGGAAEAAKKKPKKVVVVLGPNLVVNPSFELSDIEGNPAAAPGSQSQPLLPTGWRFEGNTVLFDHSQNVHHSGKRAAAISGSLSGGTQFCETGSCVNNPLNPVKDQLNSTYMLAPHWKTQAAIPVTAGKTYQLSFWATYTNITKGKGFDAIARWTNASGSVVLQQKLAEDAVGGNLDWKQFTVPKIVAPAGATGVTLLLGQSDDAWTGQDAFDDVYFGTYTAS